MASPRGCQAVTSRLKFWQGDENSARRNMSDFYFVVLALYDSRGYRGETNDEILSDTIASIDHIKNMEARLLTQHRDKADRAVIVAPPLRLRGEFEAAPEPKRSVYMMVYAALGKAGRREEYSVECALDAPLHSVAQIRYVEDLMLVKHATWAHQVNIVSCPLFLRNEDCGTTPDSRDNTLRFQAH
jgi:hypothetical protein